ncbi:hypothetical protein FQR65_LT18635 [Abscondita terminalis]|nr:hypothetical protein FQR65_LT18635 [Abscondita terminalis]
MHNALNGEHLTIEQTSKKIKITPLIGIRKDKAAYSFTPKDAINLRKTAIENNYGGVGMFFLSKDTPSEIVKEKGNGQLDDYIDKNPLKANLISGMGYEKFTFAKILNGTITDENQLVAYELSMGNMRKAADMLKQAFVKSQKENITDVVNKYTGSTSKNFPKKIDISIDGSAQFLDKQTLVLATALSELQKEYNGQ